MRHTDIFARLFCVVMLLGSFGVAGGQTLNANGETVTANKTVTLTSDLTLKGTININKGATLTVDGNGKKIITYTTGFTTNKDVKDPISFQVYAGGKLILKNVILDGDNPSANKVGNTYGGGNEGAVNAGSDFSKIGTAIVVYDNAVLDLQNVTAKNLFNKDYAAFVYAVNNQAGKDPAATITMNNVKVDNCLSYNDNGIIYTGGGDMSSNITLTYCTISNCMVKKHGTGTGYGGVVKGAGGTICVLTMNNCTMEYCWGSGWGGAILWAASGPGAKAVFKDCIFKNNYARYLGGAISTEATIELTGCTIKDNTAGFGGGGLAAFPFTLSANAGQVPNVGLNLKEGNKIINNKTLFVTNHNGANVTSGCNKKSDSQTVTQENSKGFNPRYTLLDATDVWYPTGGGGIYILMNKDGWNANMDFSASGNEISGNVSASEGGGIFMYKQKPHRSAIENEDSEFVAGQDRAVFLDNYDNGTGLVSMTLASIVSNNEASSSGGGVAVGADENSVDAWYPSVTVIGGAITDNITLNGNGGGVYMPGGAFTINGGSITNNKARVKSGATASASAGNGGGIAITNGTFAITESKITISGNEANHYGGGLYVSNTKAANIAFSGGTFTGNSAYAGGGACVDGPVTLTVTNSNFESNTAKVGGGICLTGGTSNTKATMTYNSGRIRNNTANTTNGTDTGITGGTSIGTAYQKGISDGLEGIGGGVFLDSYSSLAFGNTNTPIGLYNNLAYNGADDIFANGEGTSVHLPNVNGMKLDDFKVPVAPEYLYWVKDYITGDTGYENAPKMEDEPKYTGSAGVKRYRYALSSMSENDLYWKLSSDTYTGYVSVALGYEVIYAIINKYGLEKGKGENAIFTLTQGDDTTPYLRMVVSADNAYSSSTATVNGETVPVISKRVALPAGKWTIAETSWSWAYNLTLPDEFINTEKNTKNGNAYTRELTQDTTKADSDVAVFNFINTKKEGASDLRIENIKVNKMNASPSGSSK